jgi:hypothetical protein
MMGSEMPKKRRMAAPSSSMTEDDVVDGDAASEAAIVLGAGVADQAEKDEGRADRINQRQQRGEGDQKGVPNQHGCISPGLSPGLHPSLPERAHLT